MRTLKFSLLSLLLCMTLILSASAAPGRVLEARAVPPPRPFPDASWDINRRMNVDETWSTPIVISFDPSSYSAGPAVAVDNNGQVHVMWSDSVEPVHGIFTTYVVYRARSASGVWSAAEVLEEFHRGAMDVDLIVDRNGNLHAVWVAWGPTGDDIFYSTKSVGGNWSTPTWISGTEGGSAFLPCIGIDIEGMVHVVWEDELPDDPNRTHGIFYSAKPMHGSWTSPIGILSGGSQPHLAIDTGGVVHVVSVGGYGEDLQTIFYRSLLDGIWSPPLDLWQQYRNYWAHPKIAVDSRGSRHVVWYDASTYTHERVLYMGLEDGNWSTPTVVSDPSRPYYSPDVAVDGYDTLHVIWGGIGPDGLVYCGRTKAGAWSDPVMAIETGTYVPFLFRIIANPEGDLYAVWADAFLKDVYFSYRPAAGPTPTPSPTLTPTPSPDFTVTAIEVTQAIQDLDNSVPLVAGKRTFARVHVRNQGTPSSAQVTARLCGPGRCLAPLNPGGRIQVLTNPDRARLDQSFYFELPPEWLSGTLALTAEVNPAGPQRVEESNTANNSLSRSVPFLSTPPLRLRLVNVRYGRGNTWYEAAPLHLDAIKSWLRRAYPISDLDVRVSRTEFEGVPVAGALGGSQVWSRLQLEKTLNELFGEDSRVYYGVVDDGGTVIRGLGLFSVAVGPTGDPKDYPDKPLLSWDKDDSFGDWYAGHEIGHTLGRWHAPCGVESPPWEHYPYPDGIIGGPVTDTGRYYGFDIETKAVYTPTWHDVMTYCPNQWISDYTYSGIRDYLIAQGAMATQRTMGMGEHLIVLGSVNLTQNTAELDTLYRVPNVSAPAPPISGTHRIKLLGAGDAVLADYPFTPGKHTSIQPGEDEIGLIGEVVPWVTGTQRVAVYSGTLELDSWLVSTNAPTVTVLSPNGGEVFTDTVVISWSADDADQDPLTYVLQYSADDGAIWQAIGVGITGTTVYTLDLTLLPGSDQGRVQVIASDGVNTGMDASDGSFQVGRKPPLARILSPASGSSFLSEQTIIFVGEGTDVEDGMLADSALSWQSSLSGTLGTGRMLAVTGLVAGTHVITLTATDSDANPATATVNVFAGYRIHLPLVLRNYR